MALRGICGGRRAARGHRGAWPPPHSRPLPRTAPGAQGAPRAHPRMPFYTEALGSQLMWTVVWWSVVELFCSLVNPPHPLNELGGVLKSALGCAQANAATAGAGFEGDAATAGPGVCSCPYAAGKSKSRLQSQCHIVWPSARLVRTRSVPWSWFCYMVPLSSSKASPLLHGAKRVCSESQAYRRLQVAARRAAHGGRRATSRAGRGALGRHTWLRAHTRCRAAHAVRAPARRTPQRRPCIELGHAGARGRALKLSSLGACSWREGRRPLYSAVAPAAFRV